MTKAKAREDLLPPGRKKHDGRNYEEGLEDAALNMLDAGYDKDLVKRFLGLKEDKR